MSKIKFPIDEKSLYYGMYNDYLRGQTATVSTPLNQSQYPSKWRNDILSLCNTDLKVEFVPEALLSKCTSKTTSQAQTRVDAFFVFDNLYLDGQPLNCNVSFAFYIKEEIDKFIKMKSTGKMGPNTHYGRKKLHYPQTLLHLTDGFNIDNKQVLETILKENGGFAYIVRGFECDTETRSLNFITSLVGLKGIVLSSVFRKQKGVGKKLLLEEINLEAQDISLVDLGYLVKTEKDHPEAIDIFDEINKAKIENGKLGEDYVFKYISEQFEDIEDLYHTSNDFPTSPYDIEYIQNGKKKYIEVKSTSGTQKVFNMSSGEIKFMNKYKENYTLFFVSDVRSEFPKIKQYTPEKILQLKTTYPSVRFYDC